MSERLCAECGRWRATIGHTRLSGWPPEPLTSDPVVCQLCFFEDKRRALERMRSREELRRAVAELVAIEPEPDMTLAEGELSTGFRVGPQAPYDSEVWPEVPPRTPAPVRRLRLPTGDPWLLGRRPEHVPLLPHGVQVEGARSGRLSRAAGSGLLGGRGRGTPLELHRARAGNVVGAGPSALRRLAQLNCGRIVVGSFRPTGPQTALPTGPRLAYRAACPTPP